MKKKLSRSLISFSLLLLLTACGDKGATQVEKQQEITAESTEEVEIQEENIQDEPKNDDLGASETVYNNGGNFVKVGNLIYYIKVTENAFTRTALFGEFRNNAQYGQMCAFMCYDTENGGEPVQIAEVPYGAHLAYYDGSFYIGYQDESYEDRIWRVNLQSGESQKIAMGKMCDIDPETGRFVTIQNDSTDIYLSVYEGNKQIAQITWPLKEYYAIDYAMVRDDYLIFWDVSYSDYTDEPEPDLGKLYAYDLTEDKTVCLGAVERSEIGDGLYPQLDQLAVVEEQAYFNVGFYGGTGYFLNDLSIYKADLTKENSLEKHPNEVTGEDFLSYTGFLESALPKIVMTQYQDHEVTVNYDTNTIQWLSPVEGELPKVVDLLTIPELAYDHTDQHVLELAEYVDGKVYCVIDQVELNPEEAVGWRDAYNANSVSFCEIDVEHPELKVIEKQQFEKIVTVTPMAIENPSLESYCSKEQEDSQTVPVLLVETYQEENQITDEYEWFSEYDLWDMQYGNTPEYDFYLDESYDPYTHTGYVLEIMEKDTTKTVYKVDLSQFYDPGLLTDHPGLEDAWYALYRYAHVEDNILYVSMSHRTYAETMPYTAFILAIDLETGTLLWKSENLVSNAGSFAVLDDVIICGYGFTAEDDYLYQIDKTSGKQVGERIKVRSGPDYIFYRDGQLYVRTYNTNYIYDVHQ